MISSDIIIDAEIYKYFHRFISCDLIRTTLVLLEMIIVRNGTFCLHQLGDDMVRSSIELYLYVVVHSYFLMYYLYDFVINIQ